MRPFRPEASCPLDGIRVLDLSRLVAGNMVSLQLADFGAEVIKIEDPRKGDPLRDWRTNGISVHWKVYARNKKSVTLNLRTAEGMDLLRKLASTARVFIENFRPGTLEEMGIGPDALHAINPKLIIVRVSGWGQDGPYRDKPGFGSLVEGMSTFAAKNGFADRPPVLPPLALADMIAGLYGANAVLVALREIEQHAGQGQVIDLPLLDPIFSILGPEAALYKLTQKIEPRVGSRSNNTAPRNVYETKDGRFIAISASIQSMAARLYRAIGRADMIDDPRFRTNTDRVKNIDEAERPVAEFIKARTLAENLGVFGKAEVTAAPVYDIDQFIADPHVQAREIVTELPDPEMGSVPMHHVVPRLSGTPGEIRNPAPALGEHNDAILGGLGLDAAAIAVLRKRNVI
jgi:crotonobetainyl-CoA:carnitine CoA-transferase CaiB-like acyl-CoA transferase